MSSLRVHCESAIERLGVLLMREALYSSALLSPALEARFSEFYGFRRVRASL